MSVDLNRFEHHRDGCRSDHMIYQLITLMYDLAATFVEIATAIERFSQLTEIITRKMFVARTSRKYDNSIIPLLGSPFTNAVQRLVSDKGKWYLQTARLHVAHPQ